MMDNAAGGEIGVGMSSANQQNLGIEMSSGDNARPTVESLQAMLDSDEPLEIAVQEDGSIKAVPFGTAVRRNVAKMNLEQALTTADAHIERINAPSEPLAAASPVCPYRIVFSDGWAPVIASRIAASGDPRSHQSQLAGATLSQLIKMPGALHLEPRFQGAEQEKAEDAWREYIDRLNTAIAESASVIVIGGANCCSRCRRPIVVNPSLGCHEPIWGSGIVVCSRIPNQP
jgi:hypothetical protein